MNGIPNTQLAANTEGPRQVDDTEVCPQRDSASIEPSCVQDGPDAGRTSGASGKKMFGVPLADTVLPGNDLPVRDPPSYLLSKSCRRKV